MLRNIRQIGSNNRNYVTLFLTVSSKLGQILLFCLTFCLLPIHVQLAGASPQLVNRLIPEHVRRLNGLNIPHPVGM